VEALNKRILEEKIFKILMYVSILIVLGSLFIIISLVVANGATSLSIEMITQTPTGGYYLGKSGGILNAIIGSLFLALPATGLAFIISLEEILLILVFQVLFVYLLISFGAFLLSFTVFFVLVL